MGRVHDAGSIEMPGVGAKCGVGVQLVESVCGVCGTESRKGGDNEPAVAAVGGRKADGIGAAVDDPADEHAWERGGGAIAVDRVEPVSERAEE
jgi:hypothetical protein